MVTSLSDHSSEVSSKAVMVWLGYAGLTPFYLLAALAWLPVAPLALFAQRGFGVYSLVIMAFLAGSLWGSAIVREGSDKVSRLLVSNLLAVLGAVALMVASPLAGALALAVLHLALLGYETLSAPASWYLSLRSRLTWFSMPSYLMFIAALQY